MSGTPGGSDPWEDYWDRYWGRYWFTAVMTVMVGLVVNFLLRRPDDTSTGASPSFATGELLGSTIGLVIPLCLLALVANLAVAAIPSRRR